MEGATSVPERPVLARIAAVALPFLGGPAAGSALAAWLVPGSTVAQALSFFPLSLAMIAGFYAWIGLALFTLAGRLVRRLARGAGPASPVPPGEIPPGSFAFVPLGAVAMGAAGVLCGLLPASRGWLLVTGVYVAAGTAYGALLHRLARAGYLTFPDEL